MKVVLLFIQVALRFKWLLRMFSTILGLFLCQKMPFISHIIYLFFTEKKKHKKKVKKKRKKKRKERKLMWQQTNDGQSHTHANTRDIKYKRIQENKRKKLNYPKSTVYPQNTQYIHLNKRKSTSIYCILTAAGVFSICYKLCCKKQMNFKIYIFF